jgi:formylglycine-generating enzyme
MRNSGLFRDGVGSADQMSFLAAFERPGTATAALLLASALCAQACGGGGLSPPTSSSGAAGPGSGGASTGGASTGTGGSLGPTGGQSASGGTGTGGDSNLGGAGSGGAPGAGGSQQLSDFPSCAGSTGTECAGGDCCETLEVPGGTIQVDGADYELPDFYLDKYEVTVARFRKFQEVADAWQASGRPAEGEGAHPDVPESGWQANWLEDFEEIFADGLEPLWRNYPEDYSDDPQSIFQLGFPTYQIAGANALAVNFVPYHIAFAFCIWDGGRLPAEAEWLHAATGGDTPTDYVWGDAPAPEQTFATIPNGAVPNPHDDGNEYWDLLAIPVGSHPASAGRFGHHDLASGLREYLRDRRVDEGEGTGGLIELADDENISGFSFSYPRAVISTSWDAPGPVVQGQDVTPGSAWTGFRCARDL